MSYFAMNWYVGWLLVLAGLVIGAVLGLFFHREYFLGGYTSFRRRMFRLGHIACVVLGMLNVVGAVLFLPLVTTVAGQIASSAFAFGAISMPAMCFLSGWQSRFRLGIALPVAALLTGVAAMLLGGMPCV